MGGELSFDTGPPPAPAGRATGVPASPPAEAIVQRVDFGGVVLLADDGSRVDATVRARLMGKKRSLGNTVVVGDRVSFGWEGIAGEGGRILGIDRFGESGPAKDVGRAFGFTEENVISEIGKLR